MFEIPAAAQALLGTDAVAHVWTQNPDGTPQVSVVWILVHDDEILFGTDKASHKAKNLTRNRRILLSIEDTERNERGFQRHLLIRGTAVIESGVATSVVNELCRKYVGLANHPLNLRHSDTAVTIRVSIDRISGTGPWANQPAIAQTSVDASRD